MPGPPLAALELSEQGLIIAHLQPLFLSVDPAIWLALNMCLVNEMKWLTIQWKFNHNGCYTEQVFQKLSQERVLNM